MLYFVLLCFKGVSFLGIVFDHMQTGGASLWLIFVL